jgi:hypothetical protein
MSHKEECGVRFKSEEQSKLAWCGGVPQEVDLIGRLTRSAVDNAAIWYEKSNMVDTHAVQCANIIRLSSQPPTMSLLLAGSSAFEPHHVSFSVLG